MAREGQREQFWGLLLRPEVPDITVVILGNNKAMGVLSQELWIEPKIQYILMSQAPNSYSPFGGTKVSFYSILKFPFSFLCMH